jgi:hypothetical protein
LAALADNTAWRLWRTDSGDKAAALQDGLLAVRRTTGKRGKETAVWGTVRFRGAKRDLPEIQMQPKSEALYFKIQYDDLITELVSMRGLCALKPYPRGTVRPTDLAAFTD